MAKPAPKRPQTTPEPDPETAATETIEAAGLSPADLLVPSSEAPDFAADEAELGGEQANYRWHLSRSVYLNGKRQWETCTSYPAGAGVLTADLVREDWGPGTYYAQLRPAPGSGVGHGGVKKTRTFTLAAPRSATVTPGASSSTESLLQKMIENQQAGFIRLGEMLANRPQSAGADPNQLMDLALRMAERMAPARREVDPLAEFGKWSAIFDRMRTGKDWPDLVSEGIETVRPLVELAVSRLGGDPTPNTSAPATRANGTQPQPKAEGNMWQLQLANYLRRQAPYLIGKAKAKASANLYAEVMLDNLPEAITFPQLLELLKRPNALQAVFDQLSPDLKAQAENERPWFEELLRELVGFLEAQVSGEALPAPGDKAGASGDTPAA